MTSIKNDQLPLISIIVPVYNAQNYIDRCLKSIMGQTYKRLEVILVEAGSTDRSGELCKKWVAEYQNISLIQQENEGVSHSRNVAIDKISGEYFTFVDSDDYLKSDMIEHLYDGIKKTGADVCGCGFESVRGLEMVSFQTEMTKKTPECKTAKEYLRQDFLSGNTRCWSKLFRTELLSELRFLKGLTIGEDMLFVLEYMKRAKCIAQFSDYKGYCYYINDNGAMLKPFTEQAMDQIRCWELAKERLTGLFKEDTDYQDIGAKLDKNLIISVMLTVGRLACTGISNYPECFGKCKEAIRKYCTRAGFQKLDMGYKCKVAIFYFAPKLYCDLYFIWKRKGNRNA